LGTVFDQCCLLAGRIRGRDLRQSHPLGIEADQFDQLHRLASRGTINGTILGFGFTGGDFLA